MHHLAIQKHVSYEKCFKRYIFFVDRFTQKFSITLQAMWERGFLKRILANLYCTKCNDINLFFQMSMLPFERFLIHCGLCYETPGIVFAIVFNGF